MTSVQQVIHLEAYLRLEYGPHVSVAWCIFQRNHLVVFSNRQPLICGTFSDLILELL